MTITSPARRPGRTDRPFNPGRRYRADFVDRLPGQLPLLSPEARSR